MGQRIPMEDRFWAKVDRRGDADCWPWLGAGDQRGYGLFKLEVGSQGRAHRVAYEIAIGEIPAGLTLDHSCHTRDMSCPGGTNCPHRRCVNPAHLRPMTTEENTRLGGWSRRTHCVNGHPYDEENTRLPPEGSTQGRRCRTCDRARDAARRLRNPRPRLEHPARRRTHCLRGHLLSGDNVTIDYRNMRQCRACAKDKRRRRTEAEAAAKGRAAARR